MTPSPDPRMDPDARRKAARRTALWVAGVAIAVYVTFILSGVLGQ
jgi:hypothetical protein